MCVILHFEPDSSMDESSLVNAVHNNPHGWGIIVLGEEYNDGIYVEHDVPECGETNPQDIIELLDRYKDKERILHLRWATVGEVTKENAHPFKVYDDVHDLADGKQQRREIHFMHNGTLDGFGSDQTQWYGTYSHLHDEWYDTDSGVSDSKDFATSILEPYLDRWDGQYDDWHFRNLVEKFWTGSSRGILISNFGETWKFGGKWVTLESNIVVGEVKASNDTYFDYVQRGPEQLRRKKKREAEAVVARSENRKNNEKASNFLQVVPWDTLDNPPVNFDRLEKVFRELPVTPAPQEVFSILRGLTNDEVAHLLVQEVADVKAGDFDPEYSLAFNLVLAYSHYIEILIAEVEDLTNKTAEEVINGRSNAA